MGGGSGRGESLVGAQTADCASDVALLKLGRSARHHLVLLVCSLACQAGSVSRRCCWLYWSTALTLSRAVYLGEDLRSQIVAFASPDRMRRHSPN